MFQFISFFPKFLAGRAIYNIYFVNGIVGEVVVIACAGNKFIHLSQGVTGWFYFISELPF